MTYFSNFIFFWLLFSLVHTLQTNNCGCSRDPSSEKCLGRAQPGAIRLSHHIRSRFGLSTKTNMHICMEFGSNNILDTHREGRAVDFLIGSSLDEDKAEHVFNYAISIACKVGIQEVIYNGKMWMNGVGVRSIPKDFPYGQHKDKVHIGLNKCGAKKFGL